MGGQCLIPICALKIFLHLFLHHWKILCGPGCWTRCCHGLSCPTVCKLFTWFQIALPCHQPAAFLLQGYSLLLCSISLSHSGHVGHPQQHMWMLQPGTWIALGHWGDPPDCSLSIPWTHNQLPGLCSTSLHFLLNFAGGIVFRTLGTSIGCHGNYCQMVATCMLGGG